MYKNKPKTDIGRSLLDNRRKAISNGMKLLNIEEIRKMVKDIRGENETLKK